MNKFWASVFTVLGMITMGIALFGGRDDAEVTGLFAAILLQWGWMIFDHVDLRDEIRKVQQRYTSHRF